MERLCSTSWLAFFFSIHPGFKCFLRRLLSVFIFPDRKLKGFFLLFCFFTDDLGKTSNVRPFNTIKYI